MNEQTLIKLRRSTARSHLIAVLIFLALFAQSVLPSLTLAIPPVTPDGHYTTTICTQNGLITLVLNAQGELVGELGSDGSNTHCPYCVFHSYSHNALPTGEYSIPTPGKNRIYQRSPDHFIWVPAQPLQRYLTRAPPMSVQTV